MTESNTLAPTDAEIDAIADQYKASGHGTVWPHAFARAVLAKWGAHAPARQPAAAPRNATLYDPHDVAFPAPRSADEGDALPTELASIAKQASTAAAEVAAPQPATQALDAARYQFLRDGEWRDTELESFIRLQLNTLWDAKIDAAIAAARARLGGKP